MGEDNMNPEKGGNTLRMARGRVKAPEAPPIRVVTTPDKPKPPVKPKESRVMGFIKRHKVLTAATGLSAASAAAFGAYETIPAIHEAVDEHFLKRIGLKTPEVNVPSTFDKNKAGEGIIGDNNITNVLPQNIQNLPQFDIDGTPLILIATPSKGKTATYTRSADFRAATTLTTTDGLYNKIIIDGIEANKPIPMPHDGYLFVTKGVFQAGAIDQISILFELPNGNIAFLTFSTQDTRSKLPVEIENAPINKGGSYIFQDQNWKQGLLLQKGNPALIPLVNGHVRYSIQEINPSTLEHLPSSIKTLTIENKLPRVE